MHPVRTTPRTRISQVMFIAKQYKAYKNLVKKGFVKDTQTVAHFTKSYKDYGYWQHKKQESKWHNHKIRTIDIHI